jgi:hypothetical protein
MIDGNMEATCMPGTMVPLKSSKLLVAARCSWIGLGSAVSWQKAVTSAWVNFLRLTNWRPGTSGSTIEGVSVLNPAFKLASNPKAVSRGIGVTCLKEQDIVAARPIIAGFIDMTLINLLIFLVCSHALFRAFLVVLFVF